MRRLGHERHEEMSLHSCERGDNDSIFKKTKEVLSPHRGRRLGRTKVCYLAMSKRTISQCIG